MTARLNLQGRNRAITRALFAGALLLSIQLSPAQAGVGGAATNNAATAGTNVAAIPLAQLSAQAEAASATLQTIGADVATDKTTQTVQQDLPVITGEINARLDETSRILSRGPSLEMLRRLGSEWQELREEISGWKRGLGRRATQLGADDTRLSQLEKPWQATRDSADVARIPPEVFQRLQDVLEQVRQTRRQVDAQQSLVLTLQSRVGEQDARINQSLSAVDHAREEMLEHLLVKDSPPLWSPELRSQTTSTMASQSRHSFSRQVLALDSYARRKSERFFLHALLFLAVLGCVFWARRKLRTHAGEDPALREATLVFEMPIATALVLSLMASGWFYPQAPRLLWAVLGAGALLPAALVLRRVLRRPLFPLLNALVAFYFVDQLRSVAAASELLARGLFLLELLGAIGLLAWFQTTDRLVFPGVDKTRWAKLFSGAISLALAALVAAFVTNAIGYGGLSKLLGNATLTSAYLALLLYAVIRIADGLLLTALTAGPLGRLKMVQRHRAFLQTRTRQVLEWAAAAIWALYLLEAFALRATVFADLRQLLTAHLALGSIDFSLGDLLLFAVSIWAAFMVSRVMRFVLEEEVYPHVQLAPGLHYSISRMVHYAVLVAGFLIGIALLGFNMTRLTLLASAIGVGLGFGLQNIVNNFVSGIILLFERPVKVGDVIQLDSSEGTVTHIGIRASIVRTLNGPEIIVPNGKLISDPVTNWTFSGRQRLLIIAVAVAAGAEAERVLEALKAAAAAHPAILPEPPPQALMLNFNGGALNFELRVWTTHLNDWMQVRSDLCSAINANLLARHISLK